MSKAYPSEVLLRRSTLDYGHNFANLTRLEKLAMNKHSCLSRTLIKDKSVITLGPGLIFIGKGKCSRVHKGLHLARLLCNIKFRWLLSPRFRAGKGLNWSGLLALPLVQYFLLLI
jgi:hypothetical protein